METHSNVGLKNGHVHYVQTVLPLVKLLDDHV